MRHLKAVVALLFLYFYFVLIIDFGFIISYGKVYAFDKSIEVVDGLHKLGANT